MQELECVRDEKRTRKIRIISFILSLCLIVSFMPIQAFGVKELTTSDEGIAMIKHFEGFSKYPYWDYSQWTVGYGTRCEGADLERYKREGISEAEAEKELREFLDSFENSVNRFARKHNLELTQNEFDSLVSFTFNCGAGWTSENGVFTKSVANGETGNALLFAMARWCKAGGEVQKSKIRRRIMEANVYINGVYSVVVPPHFKYVLFDHVESKYNGSTGKYVVQAYDAAATDKVRPEAYKSGYKFLGWYTAKDGGEWIDVLDNSLNDGTTLYAHWQKNDEIIANYTRTTTQEITAYDDHSTSSTIARKIAKNEKVKIVADYLDAENNKWGKLEDNTWIMLKNTSRTVKHASVFPAYGKLVTVTGDVNVRKGAGTDYEKIGEAHAGEQFLITTVKKVGNSYWGRFQDGWLCLSYTDYKHNPEKPLGTATLTGAKSENVRSLPGGEYQKLATVLKGYTVNVYELGKSSTGRAWARTELGWMSMTYLDYVEGEDKSEPQPEETTPTEPTVPETTEPEETKPMYPFPEPEKPTVPPVEETEPTPPPVEETKPTEPPVAPTEPPVEEKPPVETQPPTEDNKDEKASEGVVTASSLRIRSGPGTSYETVGSLKNGDKVKIYETRKNSSTTWGRMDKGWVCMNYIKITKETKPEPEYLEGVVTATSLNVRSGPGTKYEVVSYLHNGDKVKISELKNVSGVSWGKTDKGWVSMKYIRVNGSTETKPEFNERTGKVTADLLYVRAGAGLSYDRIGSLKQNTIVKIKNMKMVDGVPWGHISTGWISLNHVNLNAITNGSIGMINADLLNIRNAANGNKVVGQYKRGDVITIQETKTVNGKLWGKTDKGWIDMRYVR